MASYNRCVLIGNVTRDPELKHIPSGLAVVDLGLAINHRRKQGDEWVEEVDFIDVTLFGRTAEIVAEYCTKGSPLFVEGRLKLEQWEKDGEKRSKLKVIGENIQLLGSKNGGSDASQNEEPQAKKSAGRPAGKKAAKQEQPKNTEKLEEIPF